MNTFIDFYQKVKPRIKEELLTFNDYLKNNTYDTFKDNIDVFCTLNESGKLVRGSLILLGYSLKNEDIKYALPLACAYEIFETSILVHDDIIDKDNLRRGKQTINAFNNEKYHNLDSNHLANSVALCIGDLGLYQANNLIIDNYAQDKTFAKLFKTYNDIVIKTINGELLDVITPFQEKKHLFKDNIEDNVMQIYALKTSWYSITGPLLLGMILANMNDEEINDIKEFALPLGIAFQIQDDLLGIFSKTEMLGKKAGGDIKEFKQTLLYAYTKNTPYYDILLKEYGKDNYNLDIVKNIFEECGAKKYCVDKMNELYDESINKLGSINWLSDEHKTILSDLIDYLKNRDK